MALKHTKWEWVKWLLIDGEGDGTHSSTLAWKIPWMEEPGRLQSMGSLGVGHDWATSLSLFTFMHWRRKWQPTPVFLPGESQGRGSLVGCHLWGRRVGHDWSDLAAAKWFLASPLPPIVACRGPAIPRSPALVGYRPCPTAPPGRGQETGGRELWPCRSRTRPASRFLHFKIVKPSLRVKGSAVELLCFDFTQKLTRRRAVPEPLWVGMRTAHLIPLT